MYLVDKMAAWAAGARSTRFADEVWHQARRAVIDWHAALYPGAVMPPATPTIAAAHALSFGAPQFLRSVVIGYEISTRIAAAMGRAHYRYWHNTGTIGCFGAAAAAAEALGLDARRFAHALPTVATFSSGLQQAFRMESMSKPLHAGHAAEAGVNAALAAREGVTGSLDVMEGEAGHGRAVG